MKGKKLASPGPVGKVATGKKSVPPKVTKNQGLDRVTMGSAMGILGKHFK